MSPGCRPYTSPPAASARCGFSGRLAGGREVAAYVTSEALGWDLVPPTVLRPDGPAGAGSVQLYIEAERPPLLYVQRGREAAAAAGGGVRR
jgi:hypothetical protein